MPVPHTPSMRQPSALGEPWKQIWAYLPNDLRNRRNLARGGYSSRPVPDLRGQARLRPPFTSFCTAGGDELARRGGSDRGGEVAGGPSCSTQPVEGRPVARRKAPASGDRVWCRSPGTAPLLLSPHFLVSRARVVPARSFSVFVVCFLWVRAPWSAPSPGL